MGETSEATEREPGDPSPPRWELVDGGGDAAATAPERPVPVSSRHLRALRTVYDASPIGAAAWTIDGQLLHANPVFGDLVGRAPEDLIGEPFASFIDPADEAGILRAVEDLWIGERNFFECEMRCRDAAGDELWLQAHLHPVYGEDRRPEYLVSQLFSFIGHHAAPATRALAPPADDGSAAPGPAVEGDEAPVLRWYLGDGFGPRPADPAAAEFLGLPASRPAADVVDALFASIHGDDRAGFDAEWWERWGAREPFAATARSRRADGEWRWLLHRARPWFGPDGRFGGYAGASVDVTEDELARARVEAELALFRGMVEAGPLPVARTDATGSLVYASPGWESLLDDPATRLGGFGWQTLLVPENIEQLSRLARESVRTRQPFSLRVRVRDTTLAFDARPDTPVYRFWGDLRAAPVFGDDGRLDGFVAVLADISAHVAATELAERLAEVLASGTDFVVVERGGALSYINRAAQLELGVTPAAEGEPGPFLMDILDADSYDLFHRTVRPVLAESHVWTGELVVTHVTGRAVPVSVLALAHTDADEIDSVTVVARDISEIKQTDDSVSTLAHHDVLTGLPNRAALYERVAQALARRKRNGQQLALLYLDLDRFKPVNDELGHHVGDEVLEILADRMHELVRETDVIARMGGDEFAVLVEGYDDRTLVERVAERLIAAVAEPIDVADTTVTVGVSIGIAAADDSVTEPEELFTLADAAMYEAKSGGRGGYVFATAAAPTDDEPEPPPPPPRPKGMFDR